jgi:hypothetical protein
MQGLELSIVCHFPHFPEDGPGVEIVEAELLLLDDSREQLEEIAHIVE